MFETRKSVFLTSYGMDVSVGVCFSPSVMSDSVDPMDYGTPGLSVHEILQSRIIE